MSSHFSTVTLNVSNRDVRRLLASPQRLHATVMRAFGAQEQTDERVLWRLDHSPDSLLVVSPDSPRFEVLEAQIPGAVVQTTAYDPFLDALENGSTWRFRATINPVKSVKALAVGEANRGKRVPLVGATAIEDWFTQKLTTAGGTVSSTAVSGAPAISLTRTRHLSFTKGEARTRVSLATAQLDGVLIVTDADRLKSALVAGIGRARAYGCGLLTLGRPQ